MNWNTNEFRCECKELDDMICCKDDYMWNSSRYDCECNKICKFDKYLDITNFSCKFRLIGKLVEGRENEYNTIKT